MTLRQFFAPAVFSVFVSALAAQIPDFTPPSPLFGAVLTNDTVATKKLLDGGANPNEGRFLGMPVLTLAVVHGNNDAARALLAHGADPAVADANGNTALMWAVGTDKPNPAMLQELLQRGVDASAKNRLGETALTWAVRRGDMGAVAKLKARGANDSAAIRKSVENAVALLQKSGPQFVKVSGCTSCHHQSLPQMLVGAARKRGMAVDEAVSAAQVKTVLAMFRPVKDKLIDGSITLPNPGISVGYSLVGLAAEGYAPDETTAAMVTALVRTQTPEGSFATLPLRAPLESSAFTSTALSIRALQVYGPKEAARVAKAAAWLATAKPETNEDRAMRVLGLVWAGATRPDIDRATADLAATQRPDGGWGQLATLESDAYATGQALAALQIAGKTDGVERGIANLLRTQLADGSWLVRTRAYPFQPLKDSGFPHGRDQWISAAGTSWAGFALALTQPITAAAETEDR